MVLRYRSSLMAVCLSIAAFSTAFAQAPYESVGVRALGMGGAFVGVADDGSATWWNPAGLPGVGIFEASLEYGRLDTEGPGSGVVGDTAAWHVGATRIGVATPVLAFSYGRLRFAGVPDPVAGPGSGRTLHAQDVGLTLVQSVGDAVVVGSTLRLVRAGVAGGGVGPTTPVGEAVRRIGQADVDAGTHFDADVGVLASVGRLRLGLAVRHLAAPTVSAAGVEPWRFGRQARAGVSIGGEPVQSVRTWSVALDADLTTTTLPDGRRRSLAVGAERWWGGRRFAMRGGWRLQTVDDTRAAVSGGASVAARPGLLIEAHGTGGADRRDRGWGVGARLTF